MLLTIASRDPFGRQRSDTDSLARSGHPCHHAGERMFKLKPLTVLCGIGHRIKWRKVTGITVTCDHTLPADSRVAILSRSSEKRTPDRKIGLLCLFRGSRLPPPLKFYCSNSTTTATTILLFTPQFFCLNSTTTATTRILFFKFYHHRHQFNRENINKVYSII